MIDPPLCLTVGEDHICGDVTARLSSVPSLHTPLSLSEGFSMKQGILISFYAIF